MTKNSPFNTYISELFEKNSDAHVNDLLSETVDDICRNIEAYDPHKMMLNDFFFSVKESLYHHFHHVSDGIEVSEDENSVEVTDDAGLILSTVNTFDGAFDQIFMPKKVAEDEIPVLFPGFAMQNRFNSDDKSYIGFFISDQVVYMVDDFSFFHSFIQTRYLLHRHLFPEYKPWCHRLLICLQGVFRPGMTGRVLR